MKQQKCVEILLFWKKKNPLNINVILAQLKQSLFLRYERTENSSKNLVQQWLLYGGNPLFLNFFLTFIPINQSNFRGKCVSLQMYDNVRVMFNAVLLCITNEIYALVLKPWLTCIAEFKQYFEFYLDSYEIYCKFEDLFML